MPVLVLVSVIFVWSRVPLRRDRSAVGGAHRAAAMARPDLLRGHRSRLDVATRQVTGSA
ncbi:hypothetical protein [Saccharopolyspora pogona]|uniref:hypothetical protein n=1 Tax=Saccharopolyspora pogona TaxID=333966 RepID=UPI0016898624|nr:hypothetical protein [Saccharopolyspora pogona]